MGGASFTDFHPGKNKIPLKLKEAVQEAAFFLFYGKAAQR